jgi:hypothetical protein
MIGFALPLLLFEAHSPEFEPLLTIPPRKNHGLLALAKFDQSPPHPESSDDTGEATFDRST